MVASLEPALHGSLLYLTPSARRWLLASPENRAVVSHDSRSSPEPQPAHHRVYDGDLLMDSQDDEKMPFPVIDEPPAFQPRPVADAEAMSRSSGGRRRKDKGPKKSKGSGWIDFSVRGRFGSDASNRPLISAPSNFRHIHSSSFGFPASAESHGAQLGHVHDEPPLSFRPLELSIHSSNRQHMSPILPHFEFPRAVTTPPPAYLPDGPEMEDDFVVHQRSQSSSPAFHVRRKQLPDSSPSTVSDELPPVIPPRAPGRARAHTSPEVNRIKERVASAMLEMERLQRQIDDVIERQSLYASSRPSTAHSMARTVPDLEPMPSIPALPPVAPSFAERLYFDTDRPQPTPAPESSSLSSSSPVPRSLPEVIAAASPVPSPGARRVNAPLPPPLPLVLRPPLRKKKSFSRVSSWLFPGSSEDKDEHFGSITTLPRAIKGHEGFYQCVSAADSKPWRLSGDSLTTVSTWYTDDEDPVSLFTACSPESTSVMMKQEEAFLERAATFGKSNSRSSNRPGVGVAF